MAESKKHKVTIVGGGISGLTAALRLAQRGYSVTLYELQGFVGGNLGFYHPANYPDPQARYYDVYTHMYGDFYHNFWEIAEKDLGLRRKPVPEKDTGNPGTQKHYDFEPRHEVKYLDLGKFPAFDGLADIGSMSSIWQNMLSGLASPANMYLWLYSMIDTLSFQVPDDWWDYLSVHGFSESQVWSTPAVEEMYDMTLMTIWSIHSYHVSMAAYRRFMAYRLPCPTPLLWLLTGNLHTKLIDPLRAKIETYVGCTIVTLAEVVEVSLGDDRIDGLTWQKTKYDPHGRHYVPDGDPVALKIEEGEAVILALPPEPLYKLIVKGETMEQTIYSKLPQLSNVRELGTTTIPMFYVAFKKRLPDIPKENVLLRDSSYALTFLDLSQIWHDDPIIRIGGQAEGAIRTVLGLSASNNFTLPSGWSHEDVGALMIRELHQYIGEFRPPIKWGDPDCDIDWEFSYFTPSLAKLFTNVVGGMQWQPLTHYPEEIANLYFAGDCALNDIRMATVESAVVSGLRAAKAVWEKDKVGEPVSIITPETYSPSALLALNTMMAPAACAAKCWACAEEALSYAVKGDWPAARTWVLTGMGTPAAMVSSWLSRAATVFVKR